MEENSREEIILQPAEGMIYPFLRIYEENGPFLKSFKISNKLVVAGRDKTADLRIQDKYISRKHFQIEFLGKGKLFLQDLGSANGTFLNGKKVEQSKLEDGDEIIVGEKRIIISYKLPKPAKPLHVVTPDAKTKPRVDFNEKTEVAKEEELAFKAAEVTREEDPGALMERKLRLVEKTEAVSVPREIPEKEVSARTEDEKAKIISLAEKRKSAREMVLEKEEKIRLGKALVFLIIGFFVILLFLISYKYVKNYVGRENLAVRTSDEAKPTVEPLREKSVMPRPDARVVNPPASGIAKGSPTEVVKREIPREIPKPKDVRPETRTVASPSREQAKPKAVPLKEPERIVRVTREMVAKKPEVKTPARQVTPVPKPTMVTDVVNSLREKEVLGVDLNKASGTLSASREVRGGKETKDSREIDIREVQKLIDIDVGLSIMSEEVMLSEKKDVNQFRQTLKEKIAAVGYCYQEALRSNPSVYGNVKVSFTVVKGGAVKKAAIDSTSVKDSNLNSCVINRVKTTKFDDPPHDNFLISYTFRFKKSQLDFSR